jgi:hypothetical protein
MPEVQKRLLGHASQVAGGMAPEPRENRGHLESQPYGDPQVRGD